MREILTDNSKHPIKLTSECMQRIANVFHAGVPPEADTDDIMEYIQKRFNITRHTAYSIIWPDHRTPLQGAPGRPQREIPLYKKPHLSDRQRAEIIHAYLYERTDEFDPDKGPTHQELATRYNVAPSTITRTIKRYLLTHPEHVPKGSLMAATILDPLPIPTPLDPSPTDPATPILSTFDMRALICNLGTKYGPTALAPNTIARVCIIEALRRPEPLFAYTIINQIRATLATFQHLDSNILPYEPYYCKPFSPDYENQPDQAPHNFKFTDHFEFLAKLQKQRLNARFTAWEVEYILSEYAKATLFAEKYGARRDPHLLSSLAGMHGTNQSTVNNLINGHTYTDLTYFIRLLDPDIRATYTIHPDATNRTAYKRKPGAPLPFRDRY